MSPGEKRFLGVLLAIVDVGRWLAPPSRRREWRRQWRADLWHASDRIAKREGGVVERATLVSHVAGALRHAFWLRLHVRRIEMITHDLRYGWRLMLRRPGFALIAVLTLGLGVGANVTMFSWVQISLTRQLEGAPHADRFVAMNGATRTRSDLSLSYPDFLDFRQRRPASVEDLIAFTLVPMNLRTETDEAHRVWGQLVSGNFFEALEIRPPLGRGFLPEEDRTPDQAPVVVLSHDFWQRRFAGDPSIVGRALMLNGRSFTVVGVAPRGFRGTETFLSIDLWVPMMMQRAVLGGTDRLATRGNHWLETMVKLNPRARLATAQTDLEMVARDLAAAYPDNAGLGVKLYELWRAPQGGGVAVVGLMGVEAGIAAVVLLIACANVANLLLASAATRQRETAVRLALGASRSRIVQQLFTESMLLAAAGGLVGWLMAVWSKNLVRLFVPPAPLPIAFEPKVSITVLLIAVAVTTATALIFGLMPALQSSASSVVGALKESSAALTAPRRRTRLRQALVVAQVALSFVLLVSAGLFVRALRNAQAVDPGFSTRQGILASIDLLPAGYDTVRGRALQQELLARVRAVPGVEAASFAYRVPLGFGGSSDMTVRIDGYTPAPNEEMHAYYNRVSSDYFRTMGIRLVSGREFTDRDTDAAPDVAIVNETLVRRYFAGRDPIGGRIRVGPRTLQVVGVARDGKYSNITEAPRAFMYLPQPQWYRPDAVLHVKTAGDPAAIVPALHAAIRRLDANIPLFDIRTIAEHLQISIFMQRMIASLLGAFGALALALATIGLYGVIAAIAAQRTPEIGMRMALGATRGDIISLIVKQGLGMTIVGVVLGAGTAFAAARALKSLLVGVSATDAVSFSGTAALLVLVALVAVYVPARRAASIDPLVALRHE